MARWAFSPRTGSVGIHAFERPKQRIGIGSGLAAPPSPTTVHTGHVHGGSLDYVARTTREGRPRAAKKALGRAICMAGVRAIRQGP